MWMMQQCAGLPGNKSSSHQRILGGLSVGVGRAIGAINQDARLDLGAIHRSDFWNKSRGLPIWLYTMIWPDWASLLAVLLEENSTHTPMA